MTVLAVDNETSMNLIKCISASGFQNNDRVCTQSILGIFLCFEFLFYFLLPYHEFFLMSHSGC